MTLQETLEALSAAEIGGAVFWMVVSALVGWAIVWRFPLRSPRGPREPPLWGGADVLVGVGALILSEIIFVGLAVGLRGGLAGGYAVTLQIVALCLACVVIALRVRAVLGQPLETLGLRPTSWQNVAIVVALSIPARFFIGGLALLWQALLVHGFHVELEQQEAVEIIAEELREGRHLSVGLLVLGGTALAPLWEEFFFRGFLFAWLERRLGLWGGALLSGFLFALVHRSLDVFVPLWFLGVVLAWLYARSRSLLVPIVFHFLFNATTMAVLLATGGEM